MLFQWLNLLCAVSVLSICFTYQYVLSQNLDYCSRSCANEDAVKIDGQLGLCMKDCATKEVNYTWPLGNERNCNNSASVEDGNPVCSARDAAVASIKLNTSSGFKEYAAVFWRPCAIGLDDLLGYEVEIRQSAYAGPYEQCEKVSLHRKLTRQDLNRDLAVIFWKQYLDYDKDYLISVYGLPRAPNSIFLKFRYRSGTCRSLNPYGSCHCGLEGMDPAPKPNIIVQGYRLNVSISAFNSCFRVRKYELHLQTTWKGSDRPKVESRNFDPDVIMTASFYPLYPTAATFTLKYRALGVFGQQVDSEVLAVDIEEWLPPRPTLEVHNGLIKVTWQCAPRSYNITRYQVKLICNMSNSIKNVSTATVYCPKANCRGGNMTLNLPVQKEGFYSSQIREWRESGANATWSSTSNMLKDSTDRKEIKIWASAVSLTVVLLLLGTGIFFCRRSSYFRKVLKLPYSMNQTIGTCSDHEHVRKTVWIVWQADHHESRGAEVHAENIRHLAAFLANYCCLNIILDQYEVTAAPSLAFWLKEKQKQADVIIFVCPHSNLSEGVSLHQICGNFISVYNMYESALLCEDTSVKFASVVLPYSRLEFYEDAGLLLRKMPSFRLMEEIDALYFFIQNCGKAGPHGKYVVKYVNRHDYVQTDEGEKLMNGFMAMQKLLAKEDQHDSLSQSSRSLSDNFQETEINSCEMDGQDSAVQLASRFDPIPPPPIMFEEDADHAVYLLNTRELLSQQPIESEFVEAVAIDSHSLLLPKTSWNADQF